MRTVFQAWPGRLIFACKIVFPFPFKQFHLFKKIDCDSDVICVRNNADDFVIPDDGQTSDLVPLHGQCGTTQVGIFSDGMDFLSH